MQLEAGFNIQSSKFDTAVENMEVIHKGTVEIKGLQETFNLASLSQSQLQELGTKIKSAMGSQFLATG